MKYKVITSRPDIQEHVVAVFSEKSDEEAKRIFKRNFKQNPNYAWDWLTLVQYEERVVEMYRK